MKIIRAADCRTTPWKNGGGTTTEIAVGPQNASLNGFDWRVSMAHVATDGPFSDFPGIDRSLAVVSGQGLMLTIGDSAPTLLDRDSDPVSFAGDTPTSACLLSGEIVDLNVMTRRGRFEHRLLPIRKATDCDFDDHDIAIVIAAMGEVNIRSQHDAATLARGDAAVLTRTSGEIAHLAGTACYLVLLCESRNQAG